MLDRIYTPGSCRARSNRRWAGQSRDRESSQRECVVHVRQSNQNHLLVRVVFVDDLGRKRERHLKKIIITPFSPKLSKENEKISNDPIRITIISYKTRSRKWLNVIDQLRHIQCLMFRPEVKSGTTFRGRAVTGNASTTRWCDDAKSLFLTDTGDSFHITWLHVCLFFYPFVISGVFIGRVVTMETIIILERVR